MIPPILPPPGAMKLLCRFNSTLVEPLEFCNLIYYPRKNVSCATTVINNLDLLKINVIRPTKVLGSKPKIAKQCTYAQNILVFR